MREHEWKIWKVYRGDPKFKDNAKKWGCERCRISTWSVNRPEDDGGYVYYTCKVMDQIYSMLTGISADCDECLISEIHDA